MVILSLLFGLFGMRPISLPLWPGKIQPDAEKDGGQVQ